MFKPANLNLKFLSMYSDIFWYMGMSEMGYTPNYSHLVGIMISKTIGCRVHYFQTTPYSDVLYSWWSPIIFGSFGGTSESSWSSWPSMAGSWRFHPHQLGIEMSWGGMEIWPTISFTVGIRIWCSAWIIYIYTHIFIHYIIIVCVCLNNLNTNPISTQRGDAVPSLNPSAQQHPTNSWPSGSILRTFASKIVPTSELRTIGPLHELELCLRRIMWMWVQMALDTVNNS